MEPTNTDASPNSSGSTNSANVSGAPSTWPGAFHIYKQSSAAVHRNIWLIVILCALFIVESLVVGVLPLGFIAPLLNLVFGAAFSVMITRTLIAGVRGQKLTSNEIVNNNLPMLTLKMIGLELLVGSVTVVSLLLLIVPFFFVFPRLYLATYFLVDKDMGVFEAFTASWSATKGNVGKVWGIIGVEFLMILPMITVIGILLSAYWLIMYSAAYAVLYEFVSSKHA